MQIEWFNFDKLKNYGDNWKRFFTWIESVVTYNLISNKDPNCQLFTSKLEECKLPEMIKHFYSIDTNGFKRLEYEFLKLYYETIIAYPD